jgi:hypothetical protein
MLDDQENEDLEVEVTKEELKSVLLSIKKAQNPDPDGWAAEFCLGFYDFLEELLKVMSLDFQGKCWVL